MQVLLVAVVKYVRTLRHSVCECVHSQVTIAPSGLAATQASILLAIIRRWLVFKVFGRIRDPLLADDMLDE